MNKILALLLSLLATAPALAGGQIDILAPTGRSSIPGLEDLDVVPVFWDDRCVDVSFTLDDVAANPGTPAEIPSSALRPELQASFDRWNRIPTSYINMNVTAIRQLNNGLPRLDFINELTFENDPTQTSLAFSRITPLLQDMTFAVGDDLDADGDSDVFDPRVTKRNTCFDADADGDIEFPAGAYKAGTILENDVQFNRRVVWSTVPSAAPSADIQAVATHEFGHSHGLTHSAINQLSSTDGAGATMFPFIDIDDLDSEVEQRELHADDIAWSSFIYPEGTALVGPRGLQPGDVPFWLQYGVLKGEVTNALGMGVLGASVKAVTAKEGITMVEGYSGTGRLFRDATGAFRVGAPGAPPSVVIDGIYRIPVPFGLYDITMEALDGAPVTPAAIGLVVPQIGAAIGQNLFPEESRVFGKFEDGIEKLPAAATPVIAIPGLTRRGIDLVTNTELPIRHAGRTNTAGISNLAGIPDFIYAERFPNAELLPLLNAGAVVTSALFETTVFDASVVPRFKRAGLFLGRINPDGSAAIDLAAPLFADEDFIGQQGDLAPVYLDRPTRQTAELKERLLADPTLDLFLVLENNNVFETGSSGRTPVLSFEAPALGVIPRLRSYSAARGGPFRPINLNWSIELRFAPPEGNVVTRP